jgi:hypothetical protein
MFWVYTTYKICPESAIFSIKREKEHINISNFNKNKDDYNYSYKQNALLFKPFVDLKNMFCCVYFPEIKNLSRFAIDSDMILWFRGFLIEV